MGRFLLFAASEVDATEAVVPAHHSLKAWPMMPRNMRTAIA